METSEDPSAPVVRIGGLEAQTGAASIFGLVPSQGVRMAVDEINKAGGFEVAGKRYTFELISPDTQGNPQQALVQVKRMVEEQKVQYIFGPYLTNVFNAVAPYAQQHNGKLLVMGGATGMHAVLGKPNMDFAVKTMPWDTGSAGYGSMMVDLLKTRGVKKVAILCSWPHTDYSPLTVGVYLHDCDMEQGPLGVVPGSHELPLFNQYGDNGEWLGYIPDKNLRTLDLQRAKYLTGPAGSITIHNCRTVHGSPANNSDVGRPLLLYTFSSADSFAYTPDPIPSPKSGAIVRGERAEFSNHDPRPCLMPPDWSAGYTSIFSVQETGAKSNAMM